MDDFLAEMVKRGTILKLDADTLQFCAGYMREANRTLCLRSTRQEEPAKLMHEANCILADNPLVQFVLWRDNFGGALARAERAREGIINFGGTEYSFPDES